MLDKYLLVTKKSNISSEFDTVEGQAGNILRAFAECLTEETQLMTDELEQTKKQLEIAKELLIRRSAEFENYKKRTDKEKAELIAGGNEEILKQILEVYETIENMLMTFADDKATIENVDNGLRATYKQFQTVLSKYGVSEMDCKDQIFNPDLHEAVMTVPAEMNDVDRIMKVVSKGYMLNDKVLKHAKVFVSQ